MLKEIRSYATGHTVYADLDHIGRVFSERERVRHEPSAECVSCSEDILQPEPLCGHPLPAIQ